MFPNRRGSKLPVPKLPSLETFREIPGVLELDYFVIAVTCFSILGAYT